MKKFWIATAMILAITSPALAAKPGKGKRQGHDNTKQMDVDKDGAVSKTEMLAFYEMKFNAKDANKDGKLTADEMKAKKGGKKKAAGAKAKAPAAAKPVATAPAR